MAGRWRPELAGWLGTVAYLREVAPEPEREHAERDRERDNRRDAERRKPRTECRHPAGDHEQKSVAASCPASNGAL